MEEIMLKVQKLIKILIPQDLNYLSIVIVSNGKDTLINESVSNENQKQELKNKLIQRLKNIPEKKKEIDPIELAILNEEFNVVRDPKTTDTGYLQEFIDELCLMGENKFIKKQDFCIAYNSFLENNTQPIISKMNLGKEMKAKGFGVNKVKRIDKVSYRIWQGISLK